MKKIICLFISIYFVAFLSIAQKPAILIDNEPGWTKIGETKASFGKENESIIVLGDDQFKAIKIKVADAPLKIERLQVFYESGEMKDFDVKNKIEKGAESKQFDLDPKKEISKVAFTYQTGPNSKGDAANVQLYGLVAKEREQTDNNTAAYRQKDFPKESGKAMAEVTDTKYEAKVGPDGQTIYIEKSPSKYYYVDHNGEKVYISESRLKDKADR